MIQSFGKSCALAPLFVALAPLLVAIAQALAPRKMLLFSRLSGIHSSMANFPVLRIKSFKKQNSYI